MRGRIGGIHGRDLASSFGKVIAASALMGAVCFGSSHMVQSWLGLARWARLADLAVSLPLGVAVFYFSARALGVAELEMAGAAIAGPLARRLGIARAKIR
jgi:hypothetical protein